MLTGACLNAVLAGNGQLEGEHLVALLGLHQLTVLVQRDLRQIGVDLDLGHILGAVHIAAAAQVHKGLLAPIGLVEIEGVFFDLAVKGDKSLLVLAMLAALIASIGGKVEHVPHMGRPQPRTVGNHLSNVLVVNALVALGVVALFRVAALVLGVGVCAILRKADAAVRKIGMVFVKELVVLLKVPQIPAEVEVVAVHIGNFQNRTGGLQHKHVCHGGLAGGVQLVRQLVQQTVVFQQILVDSRSSGDLVRKAPHGNAGVVVVLDDQLFHLGQGVGTAVGHVHGDVGDLCPDDKTLFITQVVEIRCVLIVCQPDGVGAHFQNDGDILLHHFFGQGIARPLAVLMAGNAAQGIAAAVQDKALLGVKLKFPAAEPGGSFLAIAQLGRDDVKEGVVHAIPQMGIVQGENRLCGAVFHRGSDVLAFQRKGYALCADHGSFQSNFNGLGGKVGDDGGHLQCRGAISGQGKVLCGNDVQGHIPVNAAVEGEVRLLGVHGVVVAVVHADGQQVLVFQVVGQVHPEGRVAALVLGQLFPVQVNGGGHGCAVQLQNSLAACRDGGLFQCQRIPAGAAVVIVAAVLTVHRVPCVGQGDGLTHNSGGDAGVLFGKMPVAMIQQDGLAHGKNSFIFILYIYKRWIESAKTERAYEPFRSLQGVTAYVLQLLHGEERLFYLRCASGR